LPQGGSELSELSDYPQSSEVAVFYVGDLEELKPIFCLQELEHFCFDFCVLACTAVFSAVCPPQIMFSNLCLDLPAKIENCV